MHKKRFLTVFPDLFQKNLGNALLYKDVGSIPFYMSKACAWKSSIVYLSPEHVREIDSNYENEVSLIPIRRSKIQFINTIRLAYYLCMNSKYYDVINFYHDSPINTVYSFLCKLFNHNSVVYIKLDMDHLGVNQFIKKQSHPLALLKLSIKHLLSLYAVDVYSAECTETVDILKDIFHYRNRIVHLPNGFTPQSTIRWDDMPKKDNIIITVGRLGLKQKNNELLIEALCKIDTSLLTGWKVYFVGPVQQDSFSAYAESMILEHPILRDIIVFTGNIQDKHTLYELYKRAKIFCLTSRWEGFSLVLPEAMFFGCFVIATDLPSSRDLTKQGTIGALFPSEDAEKLALLLKKVMSDQIDVDKFTLTSHKCIRDEYDWTTIVAKLEEYFSLKA